MRWGIVGHGRIVSKFLDAARGVGHEVVAVTGREASRAAVFATNHGIGWAGDKPTDLDSLTGFLDPLIPGDRGFRAILSTRGRPTPTGIQADGNGAWSMCGNTWRPTRSHSSRCG